jgi:hypothetical protein
MAVLPGLSRQHDYMLWSINNNMRLVEAYFFVVGAVVAVVL